MLLIGCIYLDAWAGVNNSNDKDSMVMQKAALPGIEQCMTLALFFSKHVDYPSALNGAVIMPTGLDDA